MKDHVEMTRRVFGRLDRRARAAGMLISACPASQSKDFAHVSDYAVGYFDLRGRRSAVLKEGVIIEIADQVNLEAWRASRCPELDRAALPPAEIYDYLLEHELAHVRQGHCVKPTLLYEPPEYVKRIKMLSAAFELQADRDAWTVLHPDVLMPTRPAYPWDPTTLEEVLSDYEGDVVRKGLLREYKHAPLPSGRWLVPYSTMRDRSRWRWIPRECFPALQEWVRGMAELAREASTAERADVMNSPVDPRCRIATLAVLPG